MQYVQVLSATALTAIDTLRILDRQARRDTGRVYRSIVRTYWFLSSPAAMQTYRAIYRLIVILGMVAFALGMTARAMIDRFMEAQQLSTVPEVKANVLTERQIEPVTQEQTEPTVELVHAVVPFVRPMPVIPADTELVKWAKKNRSAFPAEFAAQVRKWAKDRPLRASERSMVLKLMKA